MNAKKIVKKHDKNRVLAALSYVAGFPLLLLVVLIGSIPFLSGSGFEKTKYYGIIMCIALWLVVTVIQILVSVFTRNYSTRAVTVVLFTIIIMIGGAFLFDMYATKIVDEARVKYVRNVLSLTDDKESEHYYEISFERNYSNKEYPVLKDKYGDVIAPNGTYYQKDGTKVNEWKTDKDKGSYLNVDGKVVDLSSKFLPITNYNAQINHYVEFTGGGLAESYSNTIADFCRVYNIGIDSQLKGEKTIDGKKIPINTDGSLVVDAPDGQYLFGEKGKVYKENGLFADGYIFSMPVAMEILKTYYEFQRDNGGVTKAEKKLDKALKEAENSSEWKAYKASAEFKAAYGENGTAESYIVTINRLESVVKVLGKGLVDEGVYDKIMNNMILKGILKGLAGDKIDEITKTTLYELDVDKLLNLVNGFISDSSKHITKDAILELLAPFSNYEVSNVKPVMAFIKDDATRMYAYAKYFGQVHGANVGSILIPDGSGKIGNVTLNTPGLTASENQYTLEQIYEIEALNSYVPQYYPLFAARRYLYIFAGIVSLMFVIYYYAKSKVYLTGKKLERMAETGGKF